MAKFENLPQELFLDEILPPLPVRDIVATFQVNRWFAKLGEDEVFWRRRLRQDYNYTVASTARESGFKFLYSRIHKPLLYVWGGSGHGRLGRPASQRIGQSMSDTQFWPMKLDIPGHRIIELATGGWSFSALDSKGRIHVWGQMMDGQAPASHGFSNSAKQAHRPMRLALSTPIRSISCGRGCSMALDQQGKVWCFESWGRPFLFEPNAFDPSHPDNAIIQVNCGWTFMAALNASGAVFVWSVFEDLVRNAIIFRDRELVTHGRNTHSPAVDGVIQCQTWIMRGIEPRRLPELPTLPKLTNGAEPQHRLVKIAAGDGFIVGLTNGGHVVKISMHPNSNWEYLLLFCETAKVKGLKEFQVEGGPTAPSKLRVANISAQLHVFVVYTTGNDSIVLLGDAWTTPTSIPRVEFTLQNRGVISIGLGHDHFAALLENGKLLTWGTSIATGMGDPYKIVPGKPGGFASERDKRESLTSLRYIPHINTPTEVRFDHELTKPRERFVFSMVASGHHVGALIVDLEEGEPEEIEVKPIGSKIFRYLRP
ncbi:hypothetical protein M408DRAFT_328777 [Serendipita vermifera MAFF 305830]|uniref:F-box domain-containing protein n=1 Tax=Serendipita vermifera MAFF 305830 TaxID=933852 RepID=A0A0C3BDL2_SERVB|nr:hypothetical protein M408DRAFT_328777 [Serendipita vermifera MAFF 305830]